MVQFGVQEKGALNRTELNFSITKYVRDSSDKQLIEWSPSLAGETLGMPQLLYYGLGGPVPSHRS